jgi:hypothetical protein
VLDLLLSESQPNDDFACQTVERFVDRCLRFYTICGVNTAKIHVEHQELVAVADSALPFVRRYQEPSWFKNTAAFTLSLASRKPFKTTLPSEAFGKIQGEQNTVFGMLESLYWLSGATLATTMGRKEIESPIELTDHFFTELVIAVSAASLNFQGNFDSHDDKSKACLLALVYESLVYKTNKHIPYPDNPMMDIAVHYFPFPIKLTRMPG